MVDLEVSQTFSTVTKQGGSSIQRDACSNLIRVHKIRHNYMTLKDRSRFVATPATDLEGFLYKADS